MYMVCDIDVDVRGRGVQLMIEALPRMPRLLEPVLVNIAQHKQFVPGRDTCVVDVNLDVKFVHTESRWVYS